MELSVVVSDIADALRAIDASAVPFKNFQPGVGPYGEPQLAKRICELLNNREMYLGKVETKRTPDLLIRGKWALEIKIVRPFGDNGKEAENWSVNLVHPYKGNVSLIGDCLKLRDSRLDERKAVVAIGYEHVPAQIDLEPLVRSFEAIATSVFSIPIGKRTSARRRDLIHPVHQQVVVHGWAVA